MDKTYIPNELQFKLNSDLTKHLEDSINKYADEIIDKQVNDFRIKLESMRYDLVRDISLKIIDSFNLDQKELIITLPLK